MSAMFDKRDRDWLKNHLPPEYKLTDMEETLLFTTFDAETDQDIQVITTTEKEVKYLKRVCLLKLFLFLPEYMLTRIIFGKKHVASKVKLTKLYFKFYFNKLSYRQFQKELNILMKDKNLF